MKSEDMSKDGFILLEDKYQKKYIYDQKDDVLIPVMAQSFQSSYSVLYQDMKSGDILIDGRRVRWEVPDSAEALRIFPALEKFRECETWHINQRLWWISKMGLLFDYGIYNKGHIRGRNAGESAYCLKCIYLAKIPLLYKAMEFKSSREVLDFFGLHPVAEEVKKRNSATEVKEETNPDIGRFLKCDYNSEPSRVLMGSLSDIGQLLKCDYNRCKLAPYEKSMLFDIKKGHWDLYDPKETEYQEKNGDMIGRDPRKDIRQGVVGIDFGTKSTVVTRQDGTNRIIPVRIGTGSLTDQIKASDYENPTIIECNHLQNFLDAYEKKQGRPETSCDDFFVSYYASSGFCACPAKDFYAYYADIKQWANKEKECVIVQDKQNMSYQFSSEVSGQEKMINPIELYAYYIGMYINNMRNGIYLEYLISYPVGYSKRTREFIRESFEKGIRKSLPVPVLEDEACMKDFSVRLGISEPAAYAVTALELSGLDPKDETESYMYGIFDFGGGTADFDFGTWRGAAEEEYDVEGYDYVLECFGADSDKTLGGEKILELLAYTVFKNNADIARDKSLVCSLPLGETAFLGSEMLISDSRIAMRNMSILKEELRPLWHQQEGWRDHYTAEGSDQDSVKEQLEITMYNADGEQVPNCRLAVDVDGLILLIKERIEKGVSAFFRCMEKTFQYMDRDREEEEKVYIFLAGNASKSVFVKELFEKKMEEYYILFREVESPSRIAESYFELIEPLEDRESGSDTSYIPNGKTSVAYGLVKSREGSTIKIIKNYETSSEEEARFQYYLGRERRRKFECRLSPANTQYFEWIKFQGTVKPVIRIYYTANPMADSTRDGLSIEDIRYKEVKVPPEGGKFLFIRTVKPSVIEYTVSETKEDIRDDAEVTSLDLDMQGGAAW